MNRLTKQTDRAERATIQSLFEFSIWDQNKSVDKSSPRNEICEMFRDTDSFIDG